MDYKSVYVIGIYDPATVINACHADLCTLVFVRVAIYAHCYLSVLLFMHRFYTFIIYAFMQRIYAHIIRAI